MSENRVMFQSFEWEMPNDGNFYKRLKELVPHLKEVGIDAVWLPPVYKGAGNNDVGYGAYDLYDLGEFDQKGTVRTKYGTREELLELIDTLHDNGLLVYLDVVLNHKGSADYTETFYATQVDENNRAEEIGESHEIEGWTGFDFPGRAGKYSDFVWNYNHFTGVDYDNKTGTNGIFRIDGENKGWAIGVSPEMGNFDYLMFADVDHAHPDVREELYRWTEWFAKTTRADGFRMDAVKHIDDAFMKDYLDFCHDKDPDFYLFAEYWSANQDELYSYMEDTGFNLDLFDVPLHFNLMAASQDDGYDLRTIFDGSLVKNHPLEAVTFVDNHDSQPGQSLESWVGGHFKERAYGLILLRADGYPVVFAGDYYGIEGGPAPQEGHAYDLDRLMEVRANFAYGEQVDFFQDEQAIGWTRVGEKEHPALLAVTVSMHSFANVHMSFGPEHAGAVFYDYLNRHDGFEVVLDENGEAEFPVKPASISAWVTNLSEDFYDEDTQPKALDER